MATVDRTRQYLSAYRGAIGIGAVLTSLVVTAGVTEDRSPPRKPPRVVSDGRTVTPPPVTVTETATVTAMPTQTPLAKASERASTLPSSLPSMVPSAITSPTPTPSATPTLTPSPTLTPRNHANGLKPPVCIIAIDHHGQVIKRPCKGNP